MKKLKLAKKIIEISSVGVCIGFSKIINQWLEKNQLIRNPSLSIIVCIFLIIIVFLSLQFTLELTIDIPSLRKKILGPDYVEGRWIELFYKREHTDNDDFDRKIGYSIVTIKRDEEALTIRGKNYHYDNAQHMGDFSSESLKYLGQGLLYSYKYIGNGENDEKEGIAIISFGDNGNKAPIMYTGFFINSDVVKKTSFVAWKVVNKETENRISDSQSKRDRHDFIRAFIDKMNRI